MYPRPWQRQKDHVGNMKGGRNKNAKISLDMTSVGRFGCERKREKTRGKKGAGFTSERGKKNETAKVQ